MTDINLYCPKCGAALIFIHGEYYKCTNCSYSLHKLNTIDIGFKCKGIAKALSNLCAYPFVFDGIKCASMESFIQSLKIKDPQTQKYVCSLTGPFANSIKEVFDDWRLDGMLYWKGKEINRLSYKYIHFIEEVYDALFEQSPVFRMALKKSKIYKLRHTIGCTDRSQTTLTPEEYISILYKLRDRL